MRNIKQYSKKANYDRQMYKNVIMKEHILKEFWGMIHMSIEKIG